MSTEGATVAATLRAVTAVEQRETLQSVATRALAEARKRLGDTAIQNDVWREASKIMRRMVDGQRELVADVINRALNAACWDAITACDSQLRGKLWLSAGRDNTGGLVHVAGTHLRGLMATPVRGGLLLGDATKADIAPVAAEMINSGRQEMARGLWFQRVADAIGDKVKVKDVLKQSDLENLRARALNDAGL